MYQHLTPKGIKIPNGFAVTADGYRHFLHQTGLEQTICETFEGLDTRQMQNLHSRGKRIRQLILSAPLPADLQEEIVRAYSSLGQISPHLVDVAVRSSATAEDLPDASFAGQQETY